MPSRPNRILNSYNRKCKSCGTDVTKVILMNGCFVEIWHRNGFNNGYICDTCSHTNYYENRQMVYVGGKIENAPADDNIYDKLETISIIEELINKSKLNAREKFVLIHYFGLYNNQMCTAKAVGEMLNITKSRVSQILERSIRRIRYRSGKYTTERIERQQRKINKERCLSYVQIKGGKVCRKWRKLTANKRLNEIMASRDWV